jgi:uncharacterized membrane protein YfcA
MGGDLRQWRFSTDGFRGCDDCGRLPNASAFRPSEKTVKARSGGHIATDGLLVSAVTGLVGVGGGFLVVPALVLLGGLTMHRAVATSLIIIAMKSLVGFATYASVLQTDGIEIDIEIILLVAASGIIGSFVGSAIAPHVSTEKLQKVFGIFLVVMGMFILSTSGLELINQGSSS